MSEYVGSDEAPFCEVFNSRRSGRRCHLACEIAMAATAPGDSGVIMSILRTGITGVGRRCTYVQTIFNSRAGGCRGRHAIDNVRLSGPLAVLCLANSTLTSRQGSR